MKIKSIHNRVNIAFSAFVMIIMGIVIAKVIFIENQANQWLCQKYNM